MLTGILRMQYLRRIPVCTAVIHSWLAGAWCFMSTRHIKSKLELNQSAIWPCQACIDMKLGPMSRMVMIHVSSCYTPRQVNPSSQGSYLSAYVPTVPTCTLV